jgi:hypothetical protein
MVVIDSRRLHQNSYLPAEHFSPSLIRSCGNSSSQGSKEFRFKRRNEMNAG